MYKYRFQVCIFKIIFIFIPLLALSFNNENTGNNIIYSYRVSLHISRKVEYILKMKPITQTRYLEWFSKAVIFTFSFKLKSFIRFEFFFI